jgi:hypothetical protein
MIVSRFKKACAFILSISIFFFLLNVSCKEKTKANDNKVVFDSIQVNKTQSVDYKNSKLNCNLQIAFTFPVSCKNTSQLGDLQKIFIDKVFPSQYINLPPKDAANQFSEQYIRDFQSIKFEDFFEEDSILEDENSFLYELSLENKILFNRSNFISFIVKNTNYEGGAHGSNSIYGYVIDLNTGKILTEEDFAGINYKKNLSPVIVKKIAESKGLSDVSQLEDNGYFAIGDIVPNGNFTIDDKGITYYYNEYEIAAYFVGITEVFIPYNELKPYITNENPISSLTGQ